MNFAQSYEIGDFVRDSKSGEIGHIVSVPGQIIRLYGVSFSFEENAEVVYYHSDNLEPVSAFF